MVTTTSCQLQAMKIIPAFTYNLLEEEANSEFPQALLEAL